MLHLALASNTLYSVGRSPTLYSQATIPVFPSNILYTKIQMDLRDGRQDNIQTFVDVSRFLCLNIFPLILIDVELSRLKHQLLPPFSLWRLSKTLYPTTKASGNSTTPSNNVRVWPFDLQLHAHLSTQSSQCSSLLFNRGQTKLVKTTVSGSPPIWLLCPTWTRPTRLWIPLSFKAKALTRAAITVYSSSLELRHNNGSSTLLSRTPRPKRRIKTKYSMRYNFFFILEPIVSTHWGFF